MKKWWNSYLLVAFALAAAIFIRFQGLGDPYIKAFDPYYFWRVAHGIWEKGYWQANDSLRYWPFGWESKDLAPFLPYGMVYLGRLAGDLKAGVKFYPALFGVLSILAFALLGKKLKAGGLSALILAVMPAYIFRTTQGFADKEPAAFFLGFLAWFFLISSLQKKSLIDAVYAGIAAGLLSTIWGGKILFVLSTVPLFLMLIYREKVDETVDVSVFYAIYVLMHLFVPRYAQFYRDPYSIFILGLAGFGFLFKFVYASGLFERIEKKRELALGLGIVLFIAGSAILFGDPLYIVKVVYNRAISPMEPVKTIGHFQTVAENQRPSWTWSLKQNVFFREMGLFFFVAVIGGLWAYFKGENVDDWLVGSISIFAIYTGFSAIRLFVFAAPGIALASAYTFRKLLEQKDVAVAGSAYLFLAISFFLLYPYVAATTQGVAGSSMTPTWFENLKWMEFNIPPEEPVVTWWDYGYWIQTVGNRTTLGDGGNMAPGQVLNWYTGHFFATDDYANATAWVRDWNLTYFTVDYAMVPKYWAYSTLGGISDVIGVLRLYNQQIYSPQFGFISVYTGLLNTPSGQMPVAVAPVYIKDRLYPIIGNITSRGIAWWGTAREFAVINAKNVIACPPEGYCTADALPNYPLLNYSVVFSGGGAAFIGDHQAMHSTFARLWFFNGYNTDFKLVLNNGETKTFRFEG